MYKRVSLRVVGIVAVLGLVMVLGSCDASGGGGIAGDGGFLGASFTISESIWKVDKDGFVPCTDSGTISFGMQGYDSLITADVNAGAFNVQVDAPDATLAWGSILPTLASGGLSVSEETANGYVLNNVAFSIAFVKSVSAEPVLLMNSAITTFVFLLYTDKDVDISGSGTYTGPWASNPGAIDMDISLKAGWNRVILTRTGTELSPSDTYRVGEAPADIRWAMLPG